MEHARKYRFIETNPARDIIMRFGKRSIVSPHPDSWKQLVDKAWSAFPLISNADF